MSLIIKKNTTFKIPRTSPLLIGLLAYWKLDTTGWIDSSWNGNTLIVTNGTSTNITIETGKITNATRFNYNKTFLEKSDFQFPNYWTQSFWVKIISDNVTDYNPEEEGTYPCFFDSGYISGARIAFVGGEYDCRNNWIYSNPPGANYGQVFSLELNEWYHVCVTQDSSGLKWYVNGSLYITDEGALTERSGTGLAIGAQTAANDPESRFYAAQGDYSICEYGVWNRALTGAEITSLYNAGYGKTYPFN